RSVLNSLHRYVFPRDGKNGSYAERVAAISLTAKPGARARLPPAPPHARADIDRRACGFRRRGRSGGSRPGHPFEFAQQGFRNETRARCIKVTVAVGALPLHEEALRHDQMQMILGASHGDVEKPSLLLELGFCTGGQIRWQTAIDNIENVDRLPF